MAANIIPGIKVDAGAKPLAGHPDEQVTEGLDGLRDRLAEYAAMGARFAKWRAVITIGDAIPSRACLEANAHALARYAALCQEADLVPIVEPEVLMDGEHTLERCREVTEETLHAVFDELHTQGVLLEGMLLKPNMILPGLAAADQSNADDIADRHDRLLPAGRAGSGARHRLPLRRPVVGARVGSAQRDEPEVQGSHAVGPVVLVRARHPAAGARHLARPAGQREGGAGGARSSCRMQPCRAPRRIRRGHRRSCPTLNRIEGFTMSDATLDQQCIDTLRFLSVDMVQKANSGHPGPAARRRADGLRAVDALSQASTRPIRSWADRDRFVLSAGHGSALLYSLLHVTGYELSLDDIKQFRQWGSKAPGHPERGHTAGVEVTTGPLGQGLANAVGMAIAEAHLAARYNRDGQHVVDHHTWAIVSDGDLMEGVASEAASLAGHLQLGKLICLYDNNSVTLSAGTDMTFSEDRARRFEAYGWQTISVDDGNDLAAIDAALTAARAETGGPR